MANSQAESMPAAKVRAKDASLNQLDDLPRRAYRPRTSGEVYFFQAQGGEGLIKIGWAFDAERRLAEIQTMSPLPLTLFACIPGPASLEAELHKRFRAHRAHGEWFRPAEEILVFAFQSRPRQWWKPKATAKRTLVIAGSAIGDDEEFVEGPE